MHSAVGRRLISMRVTLRYLSSPSSFRTSAYNPKSALTRSKCWTKQSQWNARSHQLCLGGVRTMFVQTEPTPNPNSLKFLPGREVLDERFTTGVDFQPGSPEVRQSPLAKSLFQIDGITRVFFGKDFVSITKAEDESWDGLRADIFATIIDFYATGKKTMSDEPVITDTTVLEDDDEIVAMIKELLEQRIRPSVQDDGGDIFYKGFDAERGIVKLQLAGSCVGCPSSSVTLKSGVENMLKHYIPEVRGIEEIVDTALEQVNKKEFQTFEEKLRSAGIPSI